MWNGQKELSLRDHRLQLLIRDATLCRARRRHVKVPTKRASSISRNGSNKPARCATPRPWSARAAPPGNHIQEKIRTLGPPSS